MKNSTKVRLAAITSALVASALLFGTASATEQPVSKSIKVSLVGIDLSTQTGVDAARQRLHQAARELCASVADDLDLSHVANFRKCVDQAMSVPTQHLDALISSSNTTRKVAMNQKQ